MKLSLFTLTTLILGAGLNPFPDAFANPTQTVAPDNTEMNKKYLDRAQPTAQDQGNSDAELQIARRIRQSLSTDDFSVYGQNLKVIVRGETVTLKGPVKSDDERRRAIEAARAAAPSSSIANQITVSR